MVYTNEGLGYGWDMTTIHAYAAHEAKGKLEPFTYEVGELADDEVEIAVRFCGICHSDVSMVNNEWGFTQYPIVPGHEVIGQVESFGKKVNHLSKGQWVGLGWHSNYCQTCHECLTGNHNLCPHAEGTIVGRYGGFADKVRAHSLSVLPLPDGMDKVATGPLLCGGITVFNPLVQFGVKPTDRVGVIGIGGLGHMALQFYRAWGCQVTAFTHSESKEKEALQMGAHQTINSRDPATIKRAAGHFDFLISTVNVKLDWNTYLATLKPKGRFHFVGATLNPLDLQLFPMIGGQYTVSASPVGAPATLQMMLEFASRHEIKPLIETYTFDQVNEAMERVGAGKAHYRVVLTP